MAGISLLKKYPGLTALCALELVVFLIVSYQIQVAPKVSMLEKMGLVLIGPVQNVSLNLFDSVSKVSEDRRTVEALRSENEQLHQRLLVLEKTQSALFEAEVENKRFRRLLDLPDRENWQKIHAEIVGRSRRRNDAIVIINKGTNQGLRADLGVACPQGVVGVIWEVSPAYSKVMTMNNPSSVIAAQVQKSRYQDCFISGLDAAHGRLENFPNFENLAFNDLVQTSGLDGIFPKGLHIGRVVKAEPSTYMFQNVDVRFSTDFNKLEEVTVLIPEVSRSDDELE